jgi:ABC-type lipoprotein export system ATPase subunit
MIRLEGVSKVYRTGRREVTALKDLDLSAPGGCFVAVKGPSGCGKSTLLMIVGGMLEPSDGRVWVCEEELGRMSATAKERLRAEKIGFVFQMFHLIPYLTVLENVMLAGGGRASRPGIREAGALLERFGLSHRTGHLPGELSAGERQRTALARAIILRPPILLADEPTGNLDPANAREVVRILTEFRENGGTVMMATHGDIVDDVADQMVEL